MITFLALWAICWASERVVFGTNASIIIPDHKPSRKPLFAQKQGGFSKMEKMYDRL